MSEYIVDIKVDRNTIDTRHILKKEFNTEHKRDQIKRGIAATYKVPLRYIELIIKKEIK